MALVRRRAAFDIGSGATKLQIADVDVASSKVVNVVFAQEVPVKFALDWKAHGRLSEAITNEGIIVLRKLCAECVAHGAEAIAAVATEVFRKAPNGKAYLERVERELGLVVEVVEQDVEARLGFLTACALSMAPRSSIIAWDSGGASFQISSEPASFSGALAIYSGAVGASVATAMLVEQVQGSTLHDTPSPNPVSVEHANELVRLLRAGLADVPAWLLGVEGICAIGGPNSLFNVAAMVIRAEGIGSPAGEKEGAEHGAQPARQAEVESEIDSASDEGKDVFVVAAAPSLALVDAEGFVAGPRPVLLRRADVRSAILARCGESDETLELLGYGEVALLVPKLCLLLAVMEHAHIERVAFLPAIGSCAGLLVSDACYVEGRRLCVDSTFTAGAR